MTTSSTLEGVDPYALASYHFDLPQELIAQYPLKERDQCRLLLVNKNTGDLSEIVFHELVHWLGDRDRLVLNNTKVIPAVLHGYRPTGAKVEMLLLKELKKGKWRVLAKPGRKLKVGAIVQFSDGSEAKVMEVLEDGSRVMEFSHEGTFSQFLARCGQMPLPPYIKRSELCPEDEQNYQTVFAQKPGAVAAPTAGLHFTQRMLETLDQKGVSSHYLTLHVGAGTFLPVQAEDIRNHPMHTELYEIDQKVASTLNDKSNGRTVCVGTTCCRALEASCREMNSIQAGVGETDIFIYPGYQFRYVDSLLTNFHLPGSTLLMLVSALAGPEIIREAYKKAVKDKFRFFSYGDAMLIY